MLNGKFRGEDIGSGVDHPLAADDVLVGGEGADTFLIQPLINAKKDIILRHVNDDRSIHWGGVAGENRSSAFLASVRRPATRS